MKKQINLVLAVVIALALGVSGFFGGIFYQKKQLAQARGSFTSRAGMNNGSIRIGNGNGQNQIRPVNGQILNQDDKSITVKLQDGSTKIVLISDSTNIAKSTNGAKSDLQRGQQVMATGTQNSDGSITAQDIQIRSDN